MAESLNRYFELQACLHDAGEGRYWKLQDFEQREGCESLSRRQIVPQQHVDSESADIDEDGSHNPANGASCLRIHFPFDGYQLPLALLVKVVNHRLLPSEQLDQLDPLKQLGQQLNPLISSLNGLLLVLELPPHDRHVLVFGSHIGEQVCGAKQYQFCITYERHHDGHHAEAKEPCSAQ